jgi:hypothetical protein
MALWVATTVMVLLMRIVGFARILEMADWQSENHQHQALDNPGVLGNYELKKQTPVAEVPLPVYRRLSRGPHHVLFCCPYLIQGA